LTLRQVVQGGGGGWRHSTLYHHLKALHTPGPVVCSSAGNPPHLLAVPPWLHAAVVMLNLHLGDVAQVRVLLEENIHLACKAQACSRGKSGRDCLNNAGIDRA